MTNKYLEKIAKNLSIDDLAVKNEIGTQAMKNVARTQLLGPIGSALNYANSPDTISDLRKKVHGKGGKKSGDWVNPALYGTAGSIAGYIPGAVISARSRTGRGAALGGAAQLGGALAGSYLATKHGIKEQVRKKAD